MLSNLSTKVLCVVIRLFFCSRRRAIKCPFRVYSLFAFVPDCLSKGRLLKFRALNEVASALLLFLSLSLSLSLFLSLSQSLAISISLPLITGVPLKPSFCSPLCIGRVDVDRRYRALRYIHRRTDSRWLYPLTRTFLHHSHKLSSSFCPLPVCLSVCLADCVRFLDCRPYSSLHSFGLQIFIFSQFWLIQGQMQL